MLAVVLLVAGAQAAGAHAVVVATEPSDGAVLDEPPSEIVIEFNEPVDPPPAAIRVFDRQGQRVDRGDAGSDPTDPRILRLDLPDGLADGTYVVTWRAVSSDAHPARGAFVLSVGEPGQLTTEIEALLAEGSDPYGLAGALLRWLRYGGTLLAAGLLVFAVGVHDGQLAERGLLRARARVAAIVGALAALAQIPVQAAGISGLGLAAMIDGGLLGDVATSSLGISVLVGAAALGLLVFLGWDRTRQRVVALAAAGLALVSLALTGHQVSTDPRWAAMAADLVHVGAAAVWLGGLVGLAWILGRRDRTADAAGPAAGMVARFSNSAVVSLLAVVVAGLVLAWLEVRALRALTTTAYGWTLLAKLAIVAGVIALGAYNNRRLVPAVRAGGQRAWERLGTIVRWEAAGIVVVLAVTAVLVNLVPARVDAGVTGAYSTVVELGDVAYSVVVDPNRAGTNDLHVQGFGPGAGFGEPTADQSLTILLSHDGREVGPLVREPIVAGPRHWIHTGPELAFPGRWRIELRLDDGFERHTATVQVDVGG